MVLADGSLSWLSLWSLNSSEEEWMASANLRLLNETDFQRLHRRGDEKITGVEISYGLWIVSAN